MLKDCLITYLKGQAEPSKIDWSINWKIKIKAWEEISAVREVILPEMRSWGWG